MGRRTRFVGGRWVVVDSSVNLRRLLLFQWSGRRHPLRTKRGTSTDPRTSSLFPVLNHPKTESKKQVGLDFRIIETEDS